MNGFLYVFIVVFAFAMYHIIRSRHLGKAIIAFIIDNPLPAHFEMLTRRLPSNYEEFLNRNDKFYRELPHSLQKSFGSRLMKFMDNKEFKTRGGLRLTWEMALIISAAAIKITFGLRDYRLSNFHTIIIYPGEFFSKASRQQVKGETNSSGIIVFSWDDIQFGNSLPNDSINLGYHEFAHALFLNHLLSPFEDEFKDQYREWLVFLKTFSILEKVKNKGIFREYGASNEAEFFAVAIENFFENPEHFKKELPGAFFLMVKILKQDPMAKPQC